MATATAQACWRVAKALVTCSCLSSRPPLVPSKYSMTVMMFVMMLSFYYFSRHVSATHPLLLCAGPPTTLSQDSEAVSSPITQQHRGSPSSVLLCFLLPLLQDGEMFLRQGSWPLHSPWHNVLTSGSEEKGKGAKEVFV